MHMHSSFEKRRCLEDELTEHYGMFIGNKSDVRELKLDIKVIFLPPYSLNLASVEYFFRIIKGKMRKYHLNSNAYFKNLLIK